MNKQIPTSIALGWLVIGLVLFAFQNCSTPESNLGGSDSNGSASSGIPGAANTSGDLSNTGISNQPVVTVPVGSRASSLYVTILYQGILQRSPTAQEQGSWAQYIGLGYGCTFIAQQVLGSAEYVALVKTLNAATMSYGVYKGLLNRAPSTGEQAAPASAGTILGTQEFKTYCSQYEKMKL